mgnify:CR=1 FL=1
MRDCILYMKKYSTKELFSHLISYSIIELANKAMPLILLPILTAFLTVEEYGKLSVLQLVFGLGTIFFSCGLTSIISVDYNKQNYYQRFEQLKITINTCAFFFIFSLPFLFFISYSYAEPVLLLVFFAAVCTAVSNFFLAFFQVGKKVKKYALLSVSQTFLNFIFTLVFVSVLLNGYEGRVIALKQLPILTAIFFYLSTFGLKFISVRVVKLSIQKKIRRALPLLVHQLSNWARYSVDKFVLFGFLGAASLGEYNVNFQLSFILSILVMVINKSFQPFILKALSKGESAFSLIVKQFITVILTGVITVFIIINFGYLLINGDFTVIPSVVIILCMSFIFQGGYLCICNYLYFYEKGASLAMNSAFCFVITLASSIPLVQNFGAVGAAVSVLTSMLILFFGTLRVFLTILRSV